MATRDFTRPQPLGPTPARSASSSPADLAPRPNAAARQAPTRPAPAAARPRVAETAPMTLPMPLDTLPLPLQTRPAALAPRPSSAAPAAARAAPRPAAGPAAGLGSWQVDAPPGRQVMLLPGQMSFTTAPATLRTLLGSCVSITVWHPGKRFGGMCHYLLPGRARRAGEALDGRYGDEAMEAMVARLLRTGTQPGEYIAHLYGGADTMPDGNGLKFNVGERNIEQGWKLIDRYGFSLEGIDVGEDVPRTVSIDIASGSIDMKRGTGKAGGLR